MEMILGGQKAASQDGKVIDVYNPATGELIDTVPSASKKDIETALKYAKKGKVKWAETPMHERCRILMKYADLVEEHMDEITTLLAKDTGKAFREAKGEVARVPANFRGYAEKALHFYGSSFTPPTAGNERDLVITKRQPLGIVVCIIPFNNPASAFAKKVAPALAMGNAVIVKPASDNPLTDIRLTELLLECGIPGEAAQVLTARGPVIGEHLLSSPDINAVSFTGSTDVGLGIAEIAAKNLHRVQLELGGNDSFIIFADADMERAVQEAVMARAPGAGQLCAASKRFLVENSIKDRFIELLVEELKKLKIGDPLDPQTDVGCMINERAALEVEEQIQHTIVQGARCVLGGKHYDRTFFEPTVLVDVTRDMDIAKDMEVFGPVFPIIGFDTLEEAVEITNASKYGLNGGVITNDFKKAIKVAEKMESGSCMINGLGNYGACEFAFGGRKMSGIGREGICINLEEMSQIKNIIMREVL